MRGCAWLAFPALGLTIGLVTGGCAGRRINATDATVAPPAAAQAAAGTQSTQGLATRLPMGAVAESAAASALRGNDRAQQPRTAGASGARGLADGVEPPPQTGALEPAPARPAAGGELSTARVPGLTRIYFGFDEAVLTPESRAQLAENARFLQQHPQLKVVVEGHCDERGTVEYNLGLGEYRARRAYDYLIDLGVDPRRLAPLTYGEEKPLDPRHTEEAWAKNRRAEFTQVQQ